MRTDGNPFFLVEYARLASERRRSRCAAGGGAPARCGARRADSSDRRTARVDRQDTAVRQRDRSLVRRTDSRGCARRRRGRRTRRPRRCARCRDSCGRTGWTACGSRTRWSATRLRRALPDAPRPDARSRRRVARRASRGERPRSPGTGSRPVRSTPRRPGARPSRPGRQHAGCSRTTSRSSCSPSAVDALALDPEATPEDEYAVLVELAKAHQNTGNWADLRRSRAPRPRHRQGDGRPRPDARRDHPAEHQCPVAGGQLRTRGRGGGLDAARGAGATAARGQRCPVSRDGGPGQRDLLHLDAISSGRPCAPRRSRWLVGWRTRICCCGRCSPLSLGVWRPGTAGCGTRRTRRQPSWRASSAPVSASRPPSPCRRVRPPSWDCPTRWTELVGLARQQASAERHLYALLVLDGLEIPWLAMRGDFARVDELLGDMASIHERTSVPQSGDALMGAMLMKIIWGGQPEELRGVVPGLEMVTVMPVARLSARCAVPGRGDRTGQGVPGGSPDRPRARLVVLDHGVRHGRRGCALHRPQGPGRRRLRGAERVQRPARLRRFRHLPRPGRRLPRDGRRSHRRASPGHPPRRRRRPAVRGVAHPPGRPSGSPTSGRSSASRVRLGGRAASGPEPTVVEQRAKRAIRRDQRPYAGAATPVVDATGAATTGGRAASEASDQTRPRAVRGRAPWSARPQPQVVEQRAKRATDETKGRTPTCQPGPPSRIERNREFPSTAGESRQFLSVVAA